MVARLTVTHFLARSRRRLAIRGTDAIGPIVSDAAASALARLYRRLEFDLGYRIYDREWDVLCVLEAARADAYFEVAGRGRAELSCASAASEWIERNFDRRYADEMRSTAYVTATPFSTVLDPRDFGLLDEVWRVEWDEEADTVLPEPVTDRAIAAARSGEHDRVIAHYLQPHAPFVGSETGFGRTSGQAVETGTDERDVWAYVASGDVDAEAAVEAYRANHRYVYERVQRLLENVDGIVAITADYANALGEWGVWGHRPYLPVPAARTVPWDVYSCTDERTRDPGSVEPAVRDPDVGASGSIGVGVDAVAEERLRRLGYRR